MTKKELLQLIEKAALEGATELDLDGKGLTTLPPEIGQLSQLSELTLRDSQLTALPPEIGRLSQLRTLWLFNNRLTDLQPEISKIARLEGLRLGNNQLTALPPEVFKLTQLRQLTPHDNRLTTVPAEIGRLAQLELLNLKGNQLTALPPEIGQLSQLKMLFLGNNQLTALPPEIGQLTKLNTLDLSGNPLISPPPEIVKQGTKAILAYLRELPRAKKQWVSKLILVGEGGVGKTTLVKRLLGEPRDAKEPTTHGIRVRKVPLKHPKRSGVTMRLKSWDFGGQEIYHATHQFFLSTRSLYVLVWHARLGWEAGKIGYWLDNIKARAPDSPVLIVATHVDVRRATLPLEDLEQKYPQIVGFRAVSCETDEGLKELRSAVQRAAADLPLMGEEWPPDWLKAAEAVRKLKKREKSITPQRLTSVLEEKNVKGKDSEVLTTWLHELGDILYFRDNPDLDDIVILDPQWVTEAISKVLESGKVVKGLGIFRRGHMNEVWAHLPAYLRDHFLRLMEQFDLSYRTLDREDISIVVERLDENPAKYEPAWNEIAQRASSKEISMTFELQGQRPPGIPTWFIARSHRFSTKTHWRYGGLFADGKERAHLGLLVASPTGGAVRLTVRGPYPHNFFALLRDGFELTLDRFKGLSVKRKIPCPGPNGIGCSHEFALEHLQTRLDRQPPKLAIECPVCFEDREVVQLLYGVDPRTHDRVLEELRRLRSDVRGVDAQVRELRALAEREFLNAYRREHAKNVDLECPCVFVLEPDPSVGDLQTLFSHSEAGLKERLLQVIRKPMVLRFFCEQPGHWHAPYDGGRYPLKKAQPWLAGMAPFLRHLGSVIQPLATLAGPTVGIASAGLEKAYAHHIKFLTEVVKLPDLSNLEKWGDMEELPRGSERVARGGHDLLPVRRLLDDLDPKREQLGLKRVVTPEGHMLWLCDEHAAEYRR